MAVVCDGTNRVLLATPSLSPAENFKSNSFEQMCINYTNEALANHYNKYTFVEDAQVWPKRLLQFCPTPPRPALSSAAAEARCKPPNPFLLGQA